MIREPFSAVTLILIEFPGFSVHCSVRFWWRHLAAIAHSLDLLLINYRMTETFLLVLLKISSFLAIHRVQREAIAAIFHPSLTLWPLKLIDEVQGIPLFEMEGGFGMFNHLNICSQTSLATRHLKNKCEMSSLSLGHLRHHSEPNLSWVEKTLCREDSFVEFPKEDFDFGWYFKFPQIFPVLRLHFQIPL